MFILTTYGVREKNVKICQMSVIWSRLDCFKLLQLAL
jgi:hypothetical protein